MRAAKAPSEDMEARCPAVHSFKIREQAINEQHPTPEMQQNSIPLVILSAVHAGLSP